MPAQGPPTARIPRSQLGPAAMTLVLRLVTDRGAIWPRTRAPSRRSGRPGGRPRWSSKARENGCSVTSRRSACHAQDRWPAAPPDLICRKEGAAISYTYAPDCMPLTVADIVRLSIVIRIGGAQRFGAPDYRAERADRDTQIIRFWPSSPTRWSALFTVSGADRVPGAPGWGTGLGPWGCASQCGRWGAWGWGGVRCKVSGRWWAWPART